MIIILGEPFENGTENDECCCSCFSIFCENSVGGMAGYGAGVYDTLIMRDEEK